MNLPLPPFLAACAVAIVAVGCGSSDDPEALTPVDHALAELGEDDFSGLVMLEYDGEQQVAGYGRADRAADVRHDTDTVYDIGSITKQFTGAAILKLQEAGALSVDDTAGEHLAELSGPVADVTIDQLLTHTAGLPDALGPDEEYVDKSGYLEMVNDASMVAEPGTMHSYSNTGYSVLAAIIESTTDTTYEAYLRRVLFDPARMENTGYVLPDWSDNEMAVGYRGDDAIGRPTEMNWSPDGPSWHLMGNGGILSTPADMMTWHHALLDDDVLTPESKEQYYARHVPEDETGQSHYGYGWAIFPREAGGDLITHDGGNGIFFADFLRFVDDGLVVLLFSNADDTVPRDAALGVAAAALGDESELPVSCGVNDLDGLDLVDDFPATEAGALTATLFDLLGDPTGPDVLPFLGERVAMSVRQGLSDDELLAAFQGIATELGGLDVSRIAVDEGDTVHTELVDESGRPAAIVTTVVGEGDPPILACFEVSA